MTGTATAGSDYTALGTSVSFAAGASTATLTVTPIQDTLIEANETILLTLAEGSGYALGSPASAMVTLTSDDVAPTVTVTASDNSATEAGLTTGRFTFSRTGSTAAALTVTYSVTGTATAGSDYQALGTSVSFAAGASTATLTVTPIQDTLIEANETILLTLAEGSGYALGSPASAMVTLTSDDVAPTVTVTASDNSATEAGLTTGRFTFSRTGSTAAALTVTYSVTGTATAASDYTALGTSVTFAAGASTATLTVTPLQDTLVEVNETILLTLATGSGYVVGSPASATVTLTSDDVAPPTVTVTASDASATEAGLTTGRFTFSRSGSTATVLTVNFSVGGTATAGSDYTALVTSVTFAAGASTAIKTVTPLQDTLVEANETILLTLAAGSGYSVGSPASATVILTSDDAVPPSVTVTASDASATEAGLTTGRFTFSRTGSTAALTVAYSVGGTATAGSDYTALGTSVSFAAGASTAIKTVTPRQDTLVEANETILLTLTAGTGYAVGTPASATVTLTSDE